LRSVKIVNEMMDIDDKRLDDREKELFLGHIVTWGSIIGGLVLAIVLTQFSSPEKEADAAPAHAEAGS
jgi:hypothetical protein